MQYEVAIEKVDTIAEGRFIKFEKVAFRDEKAQKRTWECVTRINSGGAVQIVPLILPQNEYILVRQYRVPCRCYTIEFPAGLIDTGETPEQTAPRELYEETGFEGEITRVLPPGFSSPGFSGETLTTVFMNVDGGRYGDTLPPTHQEMSENITVLRVGKAGLMDFLRDRIAAGDGVDAKLFAYAVN